VTRRPSSTVLLDGRLPRPSPDGSAPPADDRYPSFGAVATIEHLGRLPGGKPSAVQNVPYPASGTFSGFLISTLVMIILAGGLHALLRRSHWL
jgi:hypothetical protein